MNLISIPSVDSTNNYLQQLLDKGLVSEGTVVLAFEQTKGRGQRGNVWESRPGLGLYASILLQPLNWPVEKQFILNKAIACGVAWYLESRLDADVRIKWPNDILVSGRKIAGILIENSIRGSQLSAVIAGIGINLNHAGFEGDFDTAATSLKLERAGHFDPETEVIDLFREVWNAYKKLVNGEHEVIHEHYNHLLYKRGEKMFFTRGDEIISAIFLGVDDEGCAMIEQEGVLKKESHPFTRIYMQNSL